MVICLLLSAFVVDDAHGWWVKGGRDLDNDPQHVHTHEFPAGGRGHYMHTMTGYTEDERALENEDLKSRLKNNDKRRYDLLGQTGRRQNT